MNVGALFVAETTIPPSSDQASWWDYGLGSIYVLGSLAAIAAALIALVGFKPTLREWREALVARMFAWRWASPSRHLLLRKVGHWPAPPPLCRLGGQGHLALKPMGTQAPAAPTLRLRPGRARREPERRSGQFGGCGGVPCGSSRRR